MAHIARRFTALLLLVPALPAGAASSTDSPNRVEGSEFATPAGVVRSQPLGGRELSGDALEEKALAYADAERAALGLDASSTLEVASIRHGRAVDVVRFRQRAFGLPVLRSGLAVSFDREGRAIFVANDLLPLHGELEALRFAAEVAGPALDASSARGVAIERLRPQGALTEDSTVLAVFAGEDRARLVWATRISATGGPDGDWEVLVDAESGEVVRIEDRAYYGSEGQGFAFQPDPLASAGATYGDAGYTDGGDADTAQLVAQIFEVALPDLTFETGAWRLKGPYAECVDWGSPFIGCSSDPDGDFTNPPSASRSSDVFEDLNVYHHIDAYMRYLNVTLGVPVDPYQYAGGVQFDAHGWDNNDNSSYSSGTGRLRFGDGGVDDAEDPDVVIHELGHGIHDWITSGGLSQTQGLSEGTGDYVAASYSRTFFPGTWTDADPQWDWVFKWDGHNEWWGGRRLDWNDDHLYDTTLVGLHTLGQFWSSCNLDIAEAIGYPETDTAVLEGLSMTGSSTNQAQAAAAVMTAAQALGYSSDVRQTMAVLYNDASGGFGCNYGVAAPLILFADHEENNLLEWSSHVP